MSDLSSVLRALFEGAAGSISIHDQSGTGAALSSTDPDELASFAAGSSDPWIDLVTDEGEAIGLFHLGDGLLASPRPSVVLDQGMVYLLEGDPLAGQKQGVNLCPVRKLRELVEAPRHAQSGLHISSPASSYEITLMRGRRRDEPSGKWKEVTSTFGNLVTTLMEPKEGQKDGPCFLQGQSANGARKSTAQVANYILSVDLDSGQPLADVVAGIQKRGLEAVIYTTHSHLKNTSHINRDHFRKVTGSDTPDEHTVREYLIRVKGVLPAIVEKLSILDDGFHTEEGVVILVEHNPVPKFRVVFPLEGPFVFAKRGGSQKDAILEWKERYAGVCTSLGVAFDEKCVDPARLFYLPRHAPGSTSADSCHIIGKPLRIDDFDRVKINRTRGSNFNTRTHESHAGQDTSAVDRPQRFVTECGSDLRVWAAKYARRFEMQTMVEECLSGEFVREPRSSGIPGVHIECPFEAEHSVMGGNGTYVVNASDNLEVGFEGGFMVHCTHNACSGRDRLDYLKQLVDDNLISMDDLTDSAFLFALEDDDAKSAQSLTVEKICGGTLAPMTTDNHAGNPLPKIAPKTYDEHLDELVRDLCTVQTPKGFRVIQRPAAGAEPQLMTPKDAELKHKKRVILETSEKGAVKKTYPYSGWIEHADRKDFSGIAFAPGMQLKGIYNTYTGLPIKPARGDWSLLRDHIKEELCENDEDLFDWYMRWNAHLVQRPGEKPGSAILISGDKGTGKSIIYSFIEGFLGRYFLLADHKNKLTGNFNGHLDGKLLMVCEELSWTDDRDAEGVLKSLITSTSFALEKKGQDAVSSRNYTRLVMISNSPWQAPASLRDERRFFALRCGNSRQGDTEFFAAMSKQMAEGGVEALLYDLKNYKPGEGGWDALRKPPITAHLQVQQRASLDGVSKFLLQLLESGKYEFEDDEYETLYLDADAQTSVATIHLKKAANDHLRFAAPSTRAFVDVPHIRDKAIELCGAKLAKERKGPPGTNQRSMLVFPPLGEARRHFTARTGLPLKLS